MGNSRLGHEGMYVQVRCPVFRGWSPLKCTSCEFLDNWSLWGICPVWRWPSSRLRGDNREALATTSIRKEFASVNSQAFALLQLCPVGSGSVPRTQTHFAKSWQHLPCWPPPSPHRASETASSLTFTAKAGVYFTLLPPKPSKLLWANARACFSLLLVNKKVFWERWW